MNTSTKIVLVVALLAIIVGGVAYYVYTQSTPSGLKKLTVLMDWQVYPKHSGFILAEEYGYFADEGLTVTIQPSGGSSEVVKLVGAGSADFGVAAGPALISGKVEGVDLKMIGLLNQRDPIGFYWFDETIEDPYDFVGRKVGCSIEAIQYIEYRALLAKYGIAEDDIEVVPIGWDPISPLATDAVDIVVAWNTDYYRFVDAGYPDVHFTPIEDWGVGLVNIGIVAKTSYLEADPDTVEKFMRATLRGYEYMLDHPSEALDLYLENYPDMDRIPATQQFEAERQLMVSNLTDEHGLFYMEQEAWSNTLDLLYEFGVISTKPEVTTLFTRDFLP